MAYHAFFPPVQGQFIFDEVDKTFLTTAYAVSICGSQKLEETLRRDYISSKLRLRGFYRGYQADGHERKYFLRGGERRLQKILRSRNDESREQFRFHNRRDKSREHLKNFRRADNVD